MVSDNLVMLINVNGKELIKVLGKGSDPQEIGKRLAKEAIAQGANQILALTAES